MLCTRVNVYDTRYATNETKREDDESEKKIKTRKKRKKKTRVEEKY